jgi:hypothetical protein
MFTPGKVCALFAIHDVTLRRWCKALGIEPLEDAADRRRRTYTSEQVVRLAEAHKRVLLPPSDSRLEERITVLEKRMDEHFAH